MAVQFLTACPPSSGYTKKGSSYVYVESSFILPLTNESQFQVKFIYIFSPLISFQKRHEQERGDVVHTAWLPDASARGLPRRALRHHDVMLEGQARRPAHLRLHAECSGRLLHRH